MSVYEKGSMKCDAGAKVCTAREYDEQYHFTGRTRVNWNSIDWSDGDVAEFSFPSPKKISDYAPGLESSVKYARQNGELQHEVRIDKVYYSIELRASILQASRAAGPIVQGSIYKWVSDPSDIPYFTTRRNFATCVNGLCAQVWRD
jgi:hypothetical protein